MNKLAIILSSITLAGIVSAACVFTTISGNGKTATEQREVGEYHAIDVGSGFDVVLYQDGKHELLVEADSNLIEYIVTKVNDGVLHISLKKHITTSNKLIVHAHFNNLDQLSVSGGADITGTGMLKSENFALDASGGADVNLQIDIDKLNINASGGSDVNFAGTSNIININASGGSDLNLFELSVDEANVEASGGSDVKIYVLNKLHVEASGAADVIFKGKPAEIIIDKSGAADVKRMKN
jgi:hypothetical protein